MTAVSGAAKKTASRGASTGMSPVVKWGMPALVIAFTIFYVVYFGEPRIPSGVVVPNLVASPMTRIQAEAVVGRLKTATTPGKDGADIAVTFPAASWPERRAGRLALAQEFARADEIVEGRKRTIAFFDPSGSLYAKADAAGVVMLH
jgi:hypothetical protein